MNKRILIALLPALLAAACTTGAQTGAVDAGPAPERPSPASPGASPSPAPATTGTSDPQETKVVTIYYLTEKDSSFSLVREGHAVAATARIATAALEELIHGTPLREDHFTPYPRTAQILSVTISDQVATVDWSAQVLEANAGAEVESLGIQSVVWTLTEFPTVKKVRFTVEGKDRGSASNGRLIEDWWGHVGLSEQPWERDNSLRVLTTVQ